MKVPSPPALNHPNYSYFSPSQSSKCYLGDFPSPFKLFIFVLVCPLFVWCYNLSKLLDQIRYVMYFLFPWLLRSFQTPRCHSRSNRVGSVTLRQVHKLQALQEDEGYTFVCIHSRVRFEYLDVMVCNLEIGI